MDDRRDVLIFEPAAGGHEMHYVGLIAQAIDAAGLGPVTLVSTEEALAHESTAASHSAPYFSAIEAIRIAPDPVPLAYRWYKGARRQYRWMTSLARYLRGQSGRFRLVFLPFLDSAGIIPLAMGRYPFGDVPFAGIAIRPSFHYRQLGLPAPWRVKNPFEHFIYRQLLRKPQLVALFSIDPYFAKFSTDARLGYVPDPAAPAGSPVPGELRGRLCIAPDRCVILVYGHIDGRKGLSALIKAAAPISDACKLTLLVAGRQSPGLIGELPEPETSRMRAQGSLVDVNRYIGPEEEHALFAAADVVWVCYGNHYLNSSGAIVRAGMAGKPVIAPPFGYMGQTVRDHGVGRTADLRDLSAIRKAIHELASLPALRRRMGEAGARVFASHTPAAFTAPIVRMLARMGGHAHISEPGAVSS